MNRGCTSNEERAQLRRRLLASLAQCGCPDCLEWIDDLGTIWDVDGDMREERPAFEPRAETPTALDVERAKAILRYAVTPCSPNSPQHAFAVTFEEVDALVSSYLSEDRLDAHAAGSALAKVMTERMRRVKAGRNR